jgi:hypothetical protein
MHKTSKLKQMLIQTPENSLAAEL